ncbi:PspC domain-containing protein [Coprothermobacteraceae bacterium]|nr:PspC domain-containing protein [Coprothermobacteraceae bacterium]
MKKLYRSRKEKVLGGVIAGLKDYFGLDIDTNLLRLIVVALTFFIPVLAAVYLVAWVIIPEVPFEGGKYEEDTD